MKRVIEIVPVFNTECPLRNYLAATCNVKKKEIQLGKEAEVFSPFMDEKCEVQYNSLFPPDCPLQESSYLVRRRFPNGQ